MSPSLPYALQLCVLVDDPPEGDQWIHEVKFDGIRLLAIVDGRDVRLLTRNAKDWTSRFPDIAEALADLDVRDTVLDGEAAVETGEGRTSFSALPRVHAGSSMNGLRFFVFDILRDSGKDVRKRPLLERKAALAEVLEGAGDVVAFAEHVEGHGAEVYAAACAAGLEGIISKRADAPYRGTRNRDWQKVKCVREQEFVITGYTDPAGSRVGLGALVLGTYEDGRLVYRGKVGTGFSDEVLEELRQRLDRIGRKQSPFDGDVPRSVARSAHWVKPELVAEIRYTEVTEDGRLRHPVYLGLREDKPAREVRLEVPAGARRSKGRMKRTKKASRKSDARTARKSSRTSTTRPARKSTRTATGRTARKSTARSAGRTARKSGGRTARKSTRKPGGARKVKRGSERQSSLPSTVRLTSPDKVLYPAEGITKLDLAEYYAAVADRLLPHISGRPLTLVRCPSGYGEGCFFQKHLDDSSPAAIKRIEIREKSGMASYGYVDDVEGLLSLVQLGALELHTSNARADNFEKPDRLLIDLDPPEGLEWEQIAEAAIDVRDAFADLGLESFVRTTGGKGVHVVVPLTRRAGWDDLKDFSEAVASLLVEMRPDRFTTELPKQKRKGRIMLDYLRNTRGATAIESYSTRAKKGAPVATPITWDELPTIRSDSFTVFNIPERLQKQREDPWREMLTVKQSVTAAMRRKVGL